MLPFSLAEMRGWEFGHFRPRITPVSFVKAGRGCYEGTNITGERVVNRSQTQLNDALIES